MISDTERREIARKLREIEGRTTSELTDGELLDLLADKVRFGRCGSKCFDELLFGRIADLIDRPTCKNLAIKPADELLCSECGEHVDIAYMESADDYHARYCPNCGAEVCDED